MPALWRLSLDRNRITNVGYTQLVDVAAGGSLAALTYLGLADNFIGDEGLAALACESLGRRRICASRLFVHARRALRLGTAGAQSRMQGSAAVQ